MSQHESNPPSLGSLPLPRRRAVTATQTEWVRTEPAFPGRSPALLVLPAVADIDLVAWGRTNRALVDGWLAEHGAVLFRGFAIRGEAQFEAFIGAVSGGALEYSKRAGPRTHVSGHIYTATDYPEDQMIFPHNEGAFQPEFPTKLFLQCVVPAAEGGETPLGDNRWITSQIPEPIKRVFADRGVMYVRNFGSGFGLPWQTAFQTSDKGEVEAYCRAHEIGCEWYPAPGGDGECLRTRVVGPAFVRHPVTGETIWFNHATFFHVTTLPDPIRQGLLAEFDEDCLPNHTCYGDGTPIEAKVLETLRRVYRDALVDHQWQTGDILAVDNLLMVHARRPFTGRRSVVIGLAEQRQWRELGLSGSEVVVGGDN